MTMTAEVSTAQLAALVKEVQAGHEVVLTTDNKPVARIVAATAETSPSPPRRLVLRTFPNVKVLKPYFTNGEIADEMFGPDERP